MAVSRNDPNTVKYAKYLSWIFLITILSIFLSGRIEFWMPDYSHMDMVKYKTMSEASPGLSSETIQPFSYRILAPWIAGLLPFKTELSFYLLTVIALLYITYLFFNFLIQHDLEYRIAFGLTACFVFNRYFFQFFAWNYFHLTDLLSLITIMLFLLSLFNKRWITLLIVSVIGILTKETILLLIPIGYLYLIFSKATSKNFGLFTIVSFLMVAVFIILRLLIKTAGGEDLFTQFFTGLSYYFNFESVGKKFIAAFIPFGLVPFIFFKETRMFFKKYGHYMFLLIGVFIASFFGEAERLMLPFAPVYFVLIGFIIQQYLTESVNKRLLRKFLIYLMILSFLSSYYHLWGLFKLPSSIISTLTTFLLSIVTAYYFWRLKSLKIKKPA